MADLSGGRTVAACRRAARAGTRCAAAAALLGAVAGAGAQPLDLLVQGHRPAAEVRERFAPFAAWLAERAGVEIRLRVAEHPLEHWEATRAVPGPDLVLDEAHFADFRIERRGHVALAAVSGQSGFSIVTGPGALVIDPEELHGRTVASLPAPSLAAMWVLRLFPDPVRTPRLVEAHSYDDALDRVRRGEAQAAVVPSGQAARQHEFNVVLTTEEGPTMLMTASPEVAEADRRRIRAALLGAARDPQGRRALARAGLSGFEAASPDLHAGRARMLEGTWGY